eukprot:c9227_g1_i1.p1 GENE.c9227_g1_i1~~c9227_g1_i1.p1  ORF type:complete len:165 (+),score=33.42 c9227_g1_i1:465-959(+)
MIIREALEVENSQSESGIGIDAVTMTDTLFAMLQNSTTNNPENKFSIQIDDGSSSTITASEAEQYLLEWGVGIIQARAVMGVLWSELTSAQVATDPRGVSHTIVACEIETRLRRRGALPYARACCVCVGRGRSRRAWDEFKLGMDMLREQTPSAPPTASSPPHK